MFSWVGTLVGYVFDPLKKGLLQMSSFHNDFFFLYCSNAILVMCLLGHTFSGIADVGIFFLTYLTPQGYLKQAHFSSYLGGAVPAGKIVKKH